MGSAASSGSPSTSHHDAPIVTRSHPLPATLADTLLEGALDPRSSPLPPLGRVGAWPTSAVQIITIVFLLRLRFKLTSTARRDRMLLAEEAEAVALAPDGSVAATGEAARALLEVQAASDLAEPARERQVRTAIERVEAAIVGPIADYARARSDALTEDHARVRAADGRRGAAASVLVEPVLPADVIGLYVLVPALEPWLVPPAHRAPSRPRGAPALGLTFDAFPVEGALIAPAHARAHRRARGWGQNEADYGVPKGLTCATRSPLFYRIGQALFAELAAAPTPSQAATVAFAETLLRDVFGFADIASDAHDRRRRSRTLEALGGRVPVVVVPPADELDRPSATLSVTDGRRTLGRLGRAGLAQCPGRRALGLVLQRGAAAARSATIASLTRPAYIEADLRRIFEAELVRRFRRAVAADPRQPLRRAGPAAHRLRAGTLARSRPESR